MAIGYMLIIMLESFNLWCYPCSSNFICYQRYLATSAGLPGTDNGCGVPQSVVRMNVHKLYTFELIMSRTYFSA